MGLVPKIVAVFPSTIRLKMGADRYGANGDIKDILSFSVASSVILLVAETFAFYTTNI